MAVISIPLDSQVVVKFQAGLTPTGSPVIRQKTINDIKITATDEDIYEVVTALFSLSEYPVIQNILRKNYDLMEQ